VAANNIDAIRYLCLINACDYLTYRQNIIRIISIGKTLGAKQDNSHNYEKYNNLSLLVNIYGVPYHAPEDSDI